MLYLINQRVPDLEEQYGFLMPLQSDVHTTIQTAIERQSQEDGWLFSALDPITCQIASQVLGLDIPDIQQVPPDHDLFGMSTDDIAIALLDNMELGDEVMCIVHHATIKGTQYLTFVSITKWE